MKKEKKIIFTKSLAKKSSLASIFSLKYGNDTIFHYKKNEKNVRRWGLIFVECSQKTPIKSRHYLRTTNYTEDNDCKTF